MASGRRPTSGIGRRPARGQGGASDNPAVTTQTEVLANTIVNPVVANGDQVIAGASA